MKQLSMEESVWIYFILSLSGGGMDAYSYLCRDYVFANAQTGNLLLFGISVAAKDHEGMFRYLWSIVAFAVGIILADIISHKLKKTILHWKQIVLFLEVVILGSVCFIPSTHNTMANAFISLACGLQVETFRSMAGNSVATTMCIGNFRSGTYNLDKYIQTHQDEYLTKAGVYFGIIFFFVMGAVFESALIEALAYKAILFSVIMLAIACTLMSKYTDAEFE